MDGEMYGHPATRANLATLRGFGYTIVEPEVGPLASGATGQGRLAEPSALVEAVRRVVDGRPIREPDAAARPPIEAHEGRDLEGWHLIVTAGGTAEPIDPVRFIGNRSSGRMGVSIAQAALDRGARVTLIVGTMSVPLPDAADIVHAPTAEEMRAAVLGTLPDADALVMAAAVADFRPRAPATAKLVRAEGLTLELEPTADILAEAASLARAGSLARADGGRPVPGRPVIVGFAAETGSLARVPEKAARKGVDMFLANDVTEPGSGFGSETNRVTFIRPGAPPEPWPPLTKRQVAERLLDRIRDHRHAEGASSAASGGTRAALEIRP
jgi:phosphopantothenoylcysteine decarboxylase/phosphopantothenate--cysteine ligase